MISQEHHAVFSIIHEAAASENLGLLECLDTRTNTPVVVLVEVTQDEDGDVRAVPLAQIYSGDPSPFSYLKPAAENGGYDMEPKIVTP